MNYRKLLLAIFVALIIIGIFFFYNKTTQYKSQKIDVDSYEETSSGLLSKEICENDNSCKQEFNEYWKCQKIDNNERCVCIITDEQKPVCGIDDRTYRNPSEPNCLGVEIAYSGDCIISPILPNEGKECAKDSDCEKGYYCREKEICKDESCTITSKCNLRASCTITSKCILRAGCNDGVCDYETESPETCPQDCKESLDKKICNEVNTKIIEEIRKIKSCNTNSDCFRPGNLRLDGGAPALCCSIDSINKNADTSTMVTLNKKYKADCSSNFSVDCACVDTRNLEIACINNQCGVKWPSY